MDALWHPVGDGIIHQAMSSQGWQARKDRGDDRYSEMARTAARPRMAHVMMTVVLHINVRSRKMLFQPL